MRTKNYQCSQAVIGQLYIVSYRWLANSIMSTIINIVTPLIYHLLSNVWKASYTISASIFVDVPYWPPYSTEKFISCVVPGLSQWWRDRNRMHSYRWLWWMFQKLPLPAVQEICDSTSGVTPCIVTKNVRVLYHQVSSFSPERWTKVVLQELAVVCSIYRLPWRYSVEQYYPINIIRDNVGPTSFWRTKVTITQKKKLKISTAYLLLKYSLFQQHSTSPAIIIEKFPVIGLLVYLILQISSRQIWI